MVCVYKCVHVRVCVHVTICVCMCVAAARRWGMVWSRENANTGTAAQGHCGNSLKRHILWGHLASNKSKSLRFRAWD